VILKIALAGASLLVGAGLTWVGRLLHISNLDAQALAEQVAFPEPASALEWPELRVRSVVPPPGELSPVILQVSWPAHPEVAATLLVAINTRGAGGALRAAAHAVHQDRYRQVMRSAELVRDFGRHLIGERRFGVIGDLIEASSAKLLDDVLTGKVHADHLLPRLGSDPNVQSHASLPSVNRKLRRNVPVI
jgi:hypothetical protein